MSLRNVMREKLVSCYLGTPVCEVAKLMEEENIGAVLVVNDGKPVGIVTDRDLVVRCLARRLEADLVTIEEVMTPVVETISENEGLFRAIRAMKRGMVRRIVIVNDAGVATSILSFDDLFSLVAEEINDLKELVQPLDNRIERTAA